VSALLFEYIFAKSPEEIKDEEEAGKAPAAFQDVDISAMAKEFAAQITPERITPAEVQGYLMKNRDDPHAAIRGVSEWARSIVDVKDRGANVEAFENEIRESEDDARRYADIPVRVSTSTSRRLKQGRILEENFDAGSWSDEYETSSQGNRE